MYVVVLAVLVPVWAGIRIMQMGSVGLGLGVAIVGVVTVVLWVRYLRREPGPSSDGSFDVTQERVDFAIWTAIGVPFLLVGLMIVWLVADRLTQR